MKGLIIIAVVILLIIISCGALFGAVNNMIEEVNDGVMVIITVNNPVTTYAYLVSPQQESILFTDSINEEVISIDSDSMNEILLITNDVNIPWGKQAYNRGDPFDLLVDVIDGVNDRSLKCEISKCHPKVIELMDVIVAKSGIDYKK